MSFYSFSETIAYKNNGKSNDNPKGYKPVPITLIVLSTNARSSPLNGMYMYEPNIIYLGLVNWRKGRVIFSMIDIRP